VVGQAGEQEVGEKVAAAPVGSPEAEKETDWEVPETRETEILLETDCPWATLRLPPLEIEKSKAGVVIESITRTQSFPAAVAPGASNIRLPVFVKFPIEV